MTARWPAPSQLPPAKPSPGKRTWGGGAKGRVPVRGLSPDPPTPPPPARASPRWPRTSKPHPNRLSLQETRHHRICFLGQPAPRRPLQPQGADAATLLPLRSSNGQAQGAEAGAPGAVGTQRALCGAACRLRPCTHTAGRGTGPQDPGAQGSGGGTGCALARAHTAGQESPPALGPLQSSPGPSPPHRDERGTRLTAWPQMA